MGKRDGWVNVDKNPDCSPDVVQDLDDLWIWESDSVDEIYAKAVIEHCNYEHFLRESVRVLKKGCVLRLIVPHYSYPDAYFPTHKAYFSVAFFVKGFNYHSGYDYGFAVKSCKLIFANNTVINRILGFIPNMKPSLWEKVVGRAVAIDVELVKK